MEFYEYNPDKGKIETRKTLLATLCFISREKNGHTEYLMLRRDKDPEHFMYGYITPVGGKCERTETPEECISRELFEEAGLLTGQIVKPKFRSREVHEETGVKTVRITKPKFRGIVFFQNWERVFLSGNRLEKDCKCFIYELERDIEPIENNEGSLVWVKTSELRNEKIEAGDLEIFRWVKEPGLFMGRIFYNGPDLRDAKVRYYD